MTLIKTLFKGENTERMAHLLIQYFWWVSDFFREPTDNWNQSGAKNFQIKNPKGKPNDG
jgi:hypothetical protein